MSENFQSHITSINADIPSSIVYTNLNNFTMPFEHTMPTLILNRYDIPITIIIYNENEICLFCMCVCV